MLLFIIPLKSPKVSTSWQLVSKLFERCVKSICSQTIPDFRVVVVCNEIPQIQFSDDKIHYLEVNFPIPQSDVRSRDIDKANKLLKGLAYAEKFSPSHVMVVDADDCVSKHIAKFVKENPHEDGWFVHKGYIYQENSKLVYLRSKFFSKLCGSGIIVKYQLHQYLFQNEIYDHQILEIKNKLSLKPLPFHGAVYVTYNGENIYLDKQRRKELKSKLKQKGLIYLLRDTLQYRLLTDKIRNDFSLSSLTR